MAVTLFCPICNVKVDVPDRLAGKSAPCPVCRSPIDIPLHDRTTAVERALRRLAAAAPWLAAGVVLAALGVETVQLAELTEANRALKTEVEALRSKLAEAPPAPPAPAPAPKAPVEPPAPLGPDERAELQRKVASLQEALSAHVLKLREMEDELARQRGEASAAGASAEVASDADIETRVTVKTEAVGPRLKFTFEGRATNTGQKPAPAVLITLTVTQFQGLHPVTGEAVAFVPHSAAPEERLRNLAPGDTRTFWIELTPADPALMRRDVAWTPQYVVEAKVLRE
jgi:hypothetical protein